MGRRMMSIIAAFFIGWFGFYLVKGSVARDRETGVGQIMATTPLTRPLYTLGKWISNFAVLMLMVVILAHLRHRHSISQRRKHTDQPQRIPAAVRVHRHAAHGARRCHCCAL
jgi:hypothetical protein